MIYYFGSLETACYWPCIRTTEVIRMLSSDWCGKEFVVRREGSRFCSTACHDRYHIDERRKALAAYRAQQQVERTASFFNPGLQPVDDESDECNTIRRRA